MEYLNMDGIFYTCNKNTLHKISLGDITEITIDGVTTSILDRCEKIIDMKDRVELHFMDETYKITGREITCIE